MNGEFAMKILVLGADGQIGSEFREQAHNWPEIQFNFCSKGDVDILDFNQIKTHVDRFQPNFLINCSAYTAVDKAESEEEKCMQINVSGVENLVKALAGTDTVLVHFSSDYVYHVPGPWPILETSEIHPLGVYARSKAQGDLAILQSGIKAMIWRISWVVSPFRHNFIKTMVKLTSERPQLNVVDDQFGAITYTYDLVHALMKALIHTKSDATRDYSGIYNYANEGLTTWYDLAYRITKHRDIPCKIIPIPTEAYPTPAARPHWSVLDKDKVKRTFDILIPHWYDALKRCLDRLE